MSRVGKKPILLSEKVKATFQNGELQVQGPNGTLAMKIPAEITVEIDSKQMVLNRRNEERLTKSKHGLVRSLVQNMVNGVDQGFEKNLEITGVGYRAEVKGDDLHLSLGFSHPVTYPIPKEIKVSVEKQTKIKLKSADKQRLGQVTSEIRSIRPPEPYKGKGIRDVNEVVRRKAGKAAASTGGKGK